MLNTEAKVGGYPRSPSSGRLDGLASSSSGPCQTRRGVCARARESIDEIALVLSIDKHILIRECNLSLCNIDSFTKSFLGITHAHSLTGSTNQSKRDLQAMLTTRRFFSMPTNRGPRPLKPFNLINDDRWCIACSRCGHQAIVETTLEVLKNSRLRCTRCRSKFSRHRERRSAFMSVVTAPTYAAALLSLPG